MDTRPLPSKAVTGISARRLPSAPTHATPCWTRACSRICGMQAHAFDHLAARAAQVDGLSTGPNAAGDLDHDHAVAVLGEPVGQRRSGNACAADQYGRLCHGNRIRGSRRRRRLCTAACCFSRGGVLRYARLQRFLRQGSGWWDSSTGGPHEGEAHWSVRTRSAVPGTYAERISVARLAVWPAMCCPRPPPRIGRHVRIVLNEVQQNQVRRRIGEPPGPVGARPRERPFSAGPNSCRDFAGSVTNDRLRPNPRPIQSASRGTDTGAADRSAGRCASFGRIARDSTCTPSSAPPARSIRTKRR